MYWKTRKIPRNGSFRFECTGRECRICCRDFLIKKYVRDWARKNKIRCPKSSKYCMFLDEEEWKCNIYNNKPLICNMFPIVKVDKDFVELAGNCPGIGRGKKYSVNEWILRNGKSNRIEPDPDKSIMIGSWWSKLLVIISLLLSLAALPHSLILLYYPVFFTYYYFKKNNLKV